MRAARKTARQGIQSIEVGARLLQALAQAGEPQMLRDLALGAGMPAAKAHRYLVSFARVGLIEQRPETGLYDLGPFALELGLSAVARLDAVALADPVMREVCAETGQTVALAVWANQGATIVRWLGADSPVAASLRVGSVMPLTRSATGMAFLTWLPEAATARWLKRELPENSRKGLDPGSAGETARLIARTRRQGFAATRDFIPGISGVAVPVFDHSGQITLALIVLGYTKLFEAHFDRTIRIARGKAAALSERLGFGASRERSR